MKVIVPAAGLSTRFPGMRPKYLLYDYKHTLMLQNALQHYMSHDIWVGILRTHEEEYSASKYLRHEFGSKLNIVVLDKPTRGPADTARQILTHARLDLDESILIKDCDSFFNHAVDDGNYVCISSIKDHAVLKKLSSKSFVVHNDQNVITDIVEKTIVSDKFCVGGYKFRSASLFTEAFESIKTDREIFVSDVIQRCLQQGEIFTTKSVTEYYDVGTAEDWFEYNDKSVIFCDIDGTLVVAKSRFNYEEVEPLHNNIAALLAKQKGGCQIIFTTARPHVAEELTKSMLDSFGFVNYQLIMGLQNSRRILINDYNSANPFPRAEAINIKRDSDNLNDYLK